jgi:hypothetical protein
MPNRPCPNCQKTGRFLVDSSANAHVDYFRCDHCGYVWVLERSDPNAEPRVVMPQKPLTKNSS